MPFTLSRCSCTFAIFPAIDKVLVFRALLRHGRLWGSLGIPVWWFLGGSFRPTKRGQSMRDRRIPKRLVDNLQPNGKEHFVWDDTLIGFGVRMQRTGAKSYVVKYRAGSGRGAPTRRITLGRVGALTPDEARALARKTLGAVAHGNDPAAVKAAERRGATLRALGEIFLCAHWEEQREGRNTAE